MADISRRKFIIITFAAGMFIGLLFASLSFIDSQRKDSKDNLMYFTSTQAKLISANVECALSFSDAKDANAVLDTLKTQNCIAFAGIYDCNGKLFSSYHRDDVKNKEFKLVPPSKAKFTSRDGYIVVSEPVIHQQQFLGTVCLWTQP
ncbi:MAG: CHASE sensor domain-containing protein [Sedimentisphaerales bacterium]